MRRALAVLAVAAVVLTGCAESDDSPTAEDTAAASSPAESPTAEESSPAPSADASDDASDGATEGADDDAIEIEIEGDRVRPNGLRVPVEAGEKVTFDVESDRAAELHVHSSPEQVLEVGKGESTLTLVIDRPGLVDVEEHDTGLVLVQLEVR